MLLFLTVRVHIHLANVWQFRRAKLVFIPEAGGIREGYTFIFFAVVLMCSFTPSLRTNKKCIYVFMEK